VRHAKDTGLVPQKAEDDERLGCRASRLLGEDNTDLLHLTGKGSHEPSEFFVTMAGFRVTGSHNEG
jgi:hypothetical protein